MKKCFGLTLISFCGSLLLTCISCGNSDPLNNTSWYLTEVNGEQLIKDTYISISFYQKELEGYDGCNRYFGDYSTGEPDTFQTGRAGRTDQGCMESELILEQRSAYYKTLGKASFFEISGNTLIFSDSARQDILIFNRRQVHLMDSADLIGTDWMLESLNDITVPEGLEISLSFTSRNEASGRAGNYNYRLLDYEAKSDIIRWGIQSGRDGELSTDLERFALKYLDSISAGTHQYNQTENMLEIYTQRGDTLVYNLLPR